MVMYIQEAEAGGVVEINLGYIENSDSKRKTNPRSNNVHT